MGGSFIMNGGYYKNGSIGIGKSGWRIWSLILRAAEVLPPELSAAKARHEEVWLLNF